MKNTILQIQDDILQLAGTLCASMNLPRILGQLYALLYINEEPISMDEITDKLNVSKGNVSVNIKILEGWGAVKKVWVKGSRKNFYTANSDIWQIFRERLEEAFKKRMERTAGSLDNIKEKISGMNTSENAKEKHLLDFYKKRLEEIDTFKNKISKILDAVSTLNKFIKED